MKTEQEWFEECYWEGGLFEMFQYGGRDIVDEYTLPDEYKIAYKATYDAAQPLMELHESRENELLA